MFVCFMCVDRCILTWGVAVGFGFVSTQNKRPLSPPQPPTHTTQPPQQQQPGRQRGRHRELLLPLPPLHPGLDRRDCLWQGHRLPAVSASAAVGSCGGEVCFVCLHLIGTGKERTGSTHNLHFPFPLLSATDLPPPLHTMTMPMATAGGSRRTSSPPSTSSSTSSTSSCVHIPYACIHSPPFISPTLRPPLLNTKLHHDSPYSFFPLPPSPFIQVLKPPGYAQYCRYFTPDGKRCVSRRRSPFSCGIYNVHVQIFVWVCHPPPPFFSTHAHTHTYTPINQPNNTFS